MPRTASSKPELSGRKLAGQTALAIHPDDPKYFLLRPAQCCLLHIASHAFLQSGAMLGKCDHSYRESLERDRVTGQLGHGRRIKRRRLINVLLLAEARSNVPGFP